MGDLKVGYKQRAEMYISDAVSRAYLPEINESLLLELREVNEVNLSAHLPISPVKYVGFNKATSEDKIMQLLQDTVLDGWPCKHQSRNAGPYWTYREVSRVDGLFFDGYKLVVLRALRAQILEKIHGSHQGSLKCKKRVRDVLLWPVKCLVRSKSE